MGKLTNLSIVHFHDAIAAPSGAGFLPCAARILTATSALFLELAFGPGGHLLATASGDRTAWLER